MSRLAIALVPLMLLVAACGGDEGPGTVSLYDRAPVPPVPDRTHPVDAAWVGPDGMLDPAAVDDGEYWGEAVGAGSGRPIVVFDLSQALFGPACIDALGADACTDDYGVVTEPHGTLVSPIDALSSVTVVAESRQNYAVDANELASLLWGGPPAKEAPAGYAYRPYPFLLTVSGGKVVEARQIWVP